MVMKLSSITNAAAKNYQANFKGREESSLPSDENRKGSLNKWLIAGAAIAAITLGGLYFMKSKDPKAAENTAGRLKENLQGALDGAKEKTAGGFPKNPEYMSDLKSNIEKLAQNNGETLSLEGMSKHQLKAARRSLAKKTAGKSSAVPKSPDIQKREQVKGFIEVLNKRKEQLTAAPAEQIQGAGSAAERYAALQKKEAAQVRALADKTGMHADTAGRTAGQLRADRHRLEQVLERQEESAFKEKAAQDIMEGIELGAIPKPAALRKTQAPVSPLTSITEETQIARKAAKQDVKTPGVRNSRGKNGRRRAAVLKRKIQKRTGTEVPVNIKKADAAAEPQVKSAQQVHKKNISSAPAENAGKKMLDAVNQAEAQKLAEAQHTAQLYTGAVQQGHSAAAKQPIAALPAEAASLHNAAASKKETMQEYINRKNAEALQRVHSLPEEKLPKGRVISSVYKMSEKIHPESSLGHVYISDVINDVETRTRAANNSVYANKMRDGVKEQIKSWLEQERTKPLRESEFVRRKLSPASVTDETLKYINLKGNDKYKGIGI